MKLDREALSALVKLIIFLVITAIATLFLGLLLSNSNLGSFTTYKAELTDATGTAKGDDVRISGVVVGAVKKVEVIDRTKALVSFTVDANTPLTENTNVTVKFRNLVGQRYFALTQGADGAKSVLKPGSTIPESHTTPALDLNVLFNGFKPVFQALSPADTNKLANELIQTVQGEGGNLDSLLASTNSLTNTLAGRDKLVGDVITNLSQVLDTVGNRDKQLTDTIDTLQQFVTGLKNDRQAILGSVDSISGLASETADLLKQGRPALTEDINQLNVVSGNLAKTQNLRTLSTALQILPIKFKKIGNLASYGSEFNFYLCSFKGTIVIPAIPGLFPVEKKLVIGGSTNGIQTGGPRCDAGVVQGGAS